MSDQILSEVKELIAKAKAANKRHITLFDRIPSEVAETLKSDGYGVYKYAQGECTVISWGLPTGSTSGKIKIETLLIIIKQLAGNIRNILCHIFTL